MYGIIEKIKQILIVDTRESDQKEDARKINYDSEVRGFHVTNLKRLFKFKGFNARQRFYFHPFLAIGSSL
jgi:hypothetical protein